MRAEIDLADLQGDVLRGYTYPSVSYLFLKIVDPERMRDLMRRMLAQVSTAEPWAERTAADRTACGVHLRRPGRA